jgi:alpha-galactosidase
MDVSRRKFLKTAVTTAAVTLSTADATAEAASATPRAPTTSGLNLLRRPNRVSAQFVGRGLVKLQQTASEWTCQGLRVSAEPTQGGVHVEVPVSVTSDGKDLTFLHLRWNGRSSEGVLSLGDHWERSYGDLEWRSTIPDRVMPWYFLTFDGQHVNGYGVKTSPSAFCFWQQDSEGITLTIDVRNGGEPTDLKSRELKACTIVSRLGSVGEPIWAGGQELCKLMCPAPRLPSGSIFGVNDWNYAYGKNTAEGILRDADLLASLAPTGTTRPRVVIDDGWQDPVRFPSMAGLASQIRSRALEPGLWIRPLRPSGKVDASWLLPDRRFGIDASLGNFAFDPTVPEALEESMKSVSQAVGWGYSFIKHDFSTWELFGRWGSEMHAQVTIPGWSFRDRSRTNAEIVHDLYQAIRVAAGEQTTILGCNTVGHIAAGIFESQRIGDDTSGRDWERTRRYGVNALAHRMPQHRTFSHIDPDIVAMTLAVDWRKTSQWMDVVARSGTSLFLSPDPAAITPEIKSAMRDALSLSAKAGEGFPIHPTSASTPSSWQFRKPTTVEKAYDWCGPEGVSPFPV